LFVASTTGAAKACQVTDTPINGSTVPIADCVDTPLTEASYIITMGSPPSRLVATVTGDSPDVVTCPLTGDDATPLGACVSAGSSISFSDPNAVPTGLATNAASSRLYFNVFDGSVLPGLSTINSCVLLSSGSASSCLEESDASALPGEVRQLVISSAGDALFFVVTTSATDTALWSCNIDAEEGGLTGCAANSLTSFAGLPSPVVFGGGLAAKDTTLFAGIAGSIYLSCVMNGRDLTACTLNGANSESFPSADYPSRAMAVY
jgi:hypothetical protein